MVPNASRRPWLQGLIAPLAAAIVLSGCVTKGRFDQALAEQDRLEQANAELLQRNLALASVTQDLSEALTLQDREIAQLEAEQAQLQDDVTRWAVAGAVRMQLLADGLHLTLPQDVLFASGATELKPEGARLVAELAQEIKDQPYQIAVLGFTDDVPVGPKLAERFPSNWELAGARAASVVRVLEGEGIPAEQLVAVSRGATGAVASNDTPEGRAANRRIDVRMRPVIREAGE
jgi:chemotaxis protein MotB